MRFQAVIVPLFFATTVLGSSCQEVVIPPRPKPVAGADCPDACKNLRTLPGCESYGAKSKTGVTCEDACQRAIDNAFPYDSACIAGATSCAAARQCKGVAPAPATAN